MPVFHKRTVTGRYVEAVIGPDPQITVVVIVERLDGIVGEIHRRRAVRQVEPYKAALRSEPYHVTIRSIGSDGQNHIIRITGSIGYGRNPESAGSVIFIYVIIGAEIQMPTDLGRTRYVL